MGKQSKQLIEAAKNGDVSEVIRLIPLSAVNQGDKNGKTALMYAAHQGRIECVRALIPHCKTESIDRAGFTALSWATSRGHADCVEALIEHCDVNMAIWGSKLTPLMLAAVHGYVECVKALVAVSDLSATDCDGRTALSMAMKPHFFFAQKNAEVVSLIGQEVARRERAVLIDAIEFNMVAVEAPAARIARRL